MTMMKQCCRCFDSCASYTQSFILLITRLFIGLMFFQAGWGKFSDMGNTIQFFESLGIFWPAFTAYLVAAVEVIGGILLFIGLFSRLVSILLVIIMLTALFTAHFDITWAMLANPWEGGWKFLEQPQTPFLLVVLYIFAFGPGLVSVDAFMCKKSCRCD